MILDVHGVQFTLHVKHHFSAPALGKIGAKRVKQPYTAVRLHVGKCEGGDEAPGIVEFEGKATVYNGRDERGKYLDHPNKKVGRKIAFQRAVEAMFPVVPLDHADYFDNRSKRTQLWHSYWKQCPQQESPVKLAKLYKLACRIAREEAAIFRGEKKVTREEGRLITRRLDAILGVSPRA